MTDLLDRIYARCAHDEDTGCMEWQGYFHHKPLMHVNGKVVPVRRVVLQEAGRWVRGRMATNTCQNPRCVAEEHAVALTRKQLQQRTAKNTSYAKSLSHRIRTATTQRAKKSKLTPEVVQALRNGEMLLREAAELTGCSLSAAWKAKMHLRWRDYRSPFAGLLASNDSQRKAA